MTQTNDSELVEHEQEEWNGWKIISDMLDHPDENGIYPTSKAYKQLYDFVVEQKKKAYTLGIQSGIAKAEKCVEMDYEVEHYQDWNESGEEVSRKDKSAILRNQYRTVLLNNLAKLKNL